MSDQHDISVWVIIALFVPAFVLCWTLINYIIYRFAWNFLQKDYHFQHTITAQRAGMVSLRYRRMNFNGMIVAYTDDTGFYLKPVFLFSLFHKPVFIPWKDVKGYKSGNIMLIPFIMVTVQNYERKHILQFTRFSFKKLEPLFHHHVIK